MWRREWAGTQQLIGSAVVAAENAVASTVSSHWRLMLRLSAVAVGGWLACLQDLTQALQNGIQHEVEVFNVELEIICFKMPGKILIGGENKIIPYKLVQRYIVNFLKLSTRYLKFSIYKGR